MSESSLLLEMLAAEMPKLKVLIINEQLSNGIHSPLFRREFAKLLKQHRSQMRFVFDGRDHLDAYPGATLKINASAASKLAFGDNKHTPQESGTAILQKSGEELVITDGENGCFVFGNDGEITHIPAIRYDGPVDTVGAGDSFTAGFSYALAAGATLQHAAMLGTCCSAVTIRKLNQTGSPTPAEILALLP
jgi:sugar/nucleoside kinase (ribokinase family)